jgi:hypothetical protein
MAYPQTVGAQETMGFMPFVAMAASTLLQAKAQKNARKVELARVRALQQRAQAPAVSGLTSGPSMLTIAALVGLPVVAWLLFKK